MKYSINQFFKGKTTSQYTSDGVFWKSANLDIHGLEGIARINYKPTGIAGSTPNHMQGIITSFAPLFGIGGDVVFVDANKPVKRLVDTTISNIGSAALNARYVATWEGYVLAMTATALRAMAISATMDGAWAAALTAGSGSIQNTNYHKMLASSRDGKVYICNGNYVARLEKVDGQTFDPTNTDTYTLTADAFKMPKDYRVESMEDFGRFIALFVSIAGQNRTLIMLWDTESTDSADAIFEIKEIKMTSTLEHHGTIFVTGGHQGNI